jgi:acetoin utilization protein AcuB
MNLLLPVSSLMSRNIHVVTEDDNINLVKTIFDRKRVLHIVVMRDERIIGMISRSDFSSFLYGLSKQFTGASMIKSLMEIYKAGEVMNDKITFIEATDRINVALEMLRDNVFSALPVIDENEKLVGLINALDIIKALSKEKVGEQYFSVF